MEIDETLVKSIVMPQTGICFTVCNNGETLYLHLSFQNSYTFKTHNMY